MGANLIERLWQVKDFRVKDGQRHQLWMVLLFVIMGTMSGYVGDCAWGDNAQSPSSPHSPLTQDTVAINQ